MQLGREPLSPSQRIRILTRDGFSCVYCGATRATAKIEVDHVIPVAAGGTNHDGNLVAACWACNRGKRDKLIVDVIESDVGVYVNRRSPAADADASRSSDDCLRVPLEAWDASRKCQCLLTAWRRALKQWWQSVEALPQAIDIKAFDKEITFAPSFICRGRDGCDIGPEVRVLVVEWRSVGNFTCEEQLQIRNAVISGYDVPTMILMGPPDFFYGVLVLERHKGCPLGRIIDGFLQPTDEWDGCGWYPDEDFDFQDLREPFLGEPQQLAPRRFDGDMFIGVYSSIINKEGFVNGI